MIFWRIDRDVTKSTSLRGSEGPEEYMDDRCLWGAD